MDATDVQRELDSDADTAANLFREFILTFQIGDERVYLRDLHELQAHERNTLFVDFSHLQSFSERLTLLVVQKWHRIQESMTKVMLATLLETCDAEAEDLEPLSRKSYHIAIENFVRKQSLRELRSSSIGQLARISGQVVRTYPVHPELCRGFFICLDCNSSVDGVAQQFKYTQPLQCSNATCQNRTKFKLDLRMSIFTDFQRLRIQEMQNELPRGSVPRSLDVIVRGECVERCQPGDRIDFVGCLIVIPDIAQISTPGAKAFSGNARRKGMDGYEVEGVRGLKSLGVRDLNFRLAFLSSSFKSVDYRIGGGRWFEGDSTSPEFAKKLMKEEEFKRICEMRANKNLCRDLINSLFPTIYGNEEIKKGILLMLFGGVPKRTMEGTTLRGDINICIVGDPSTAKSQFLRQVEAFCPRAIYTNGRTSSAAGLTAAVVRDEESFEFVIEAGALMLADNGVCCIDEFDKMETKDQVAIHEAMEQQTISITKAGVKATLNARTSILAAANPIGGQYDRAKSLRQNINLSAPILSRFDLFFILLDEGNEATDYAVAQRINELHSKNFEAIQRPYSVEEVQRYLMFSRLWMPKLTEEAADYLVENYKRLRMRDNANAAFSSWRITVRQLESLIRLSEAVTRLHCSDVVTVNFVEQAAALLNKSMIRVEQPDLDLEDQYDQATIDGGDEAVEEQGVDEGEAADSARAKPLKVSFEQYKKIATVLVTYLRSEEDKEEAFGTTGVKSSELVNWYLEENSDGIESEEELVHTKELVEKIIERLVHHDNVLIALSASGEEQTEDEHVSETAEDPVLVVHPNYVLEEE